MLPHAEWHSPKAEIQDYSLHGGLGRSLREAAPTVRDQTLGHS